MPLERGYNFVRAGGARAFFDAYGQEYPGQELESISILGFLRMVQRPDTPRHRCLQVTGLDRLWAVCEDETLLGSRVKGLLKGQCNWVRGNMSSVYFVLPPDTDFVPATTPQIRLPGGKVVDLGKVFPGTHEIDSNHFNCDFSMS